MPGLTLYSYCRSSAAYRVRIALNLKAIEHTIVPLSLLKDGGENWKADYLALNPQGLIPAIQCNGKSIGQSVAILEFLEETYSETPLLTGDSLKRAYIRNLVQLIACDIHPLNNLRVLDYLKDTLNIEQSATELWYCHWISRGLEAFQQIVLQHDYHGAFCAGEQATLADACLIPQLYNARRFHCDLTGLQTLIEIEQHCLELEAFKQAAPQMQIDFTE